MKSLILFTALSVLTVAHKTPESYKPEESKYDVPFPKGYHAVLPEVDPYAKGEQSEIYESECEPTPYGLPLNCHSEESDRQYPVPLPAPGPYPVPAPMPYPQPGPSAPYPEPNPPVYEVKEFRKLKELDEKNVISSRIKYYKHNGMNFAIISCKKSPIPGGYTWILASSSETIPSFGVPKTVALAGGVNVQFVAVYDEKREKWQGRDFVGDEKQMFRRVGCFHGTTQSYIKN